MALSEYDKTMLSPSQQAEIERVTNAAQSGQMTWADAHSAAESIRATAGYSGGADGSGAYVIGSSSATKPSSGGGSGGGASSYSTPASTNPYAGTDYHQDAINAAIAGDWDAVVDSLNRREEKVSVTGENYGKTSAQIYSELLALYGQKTPVIPEYNSQYSSQIDSLLNSILNREEFSYDYTTDPTYQAYAQQYKRLGDRAREDTIGDIAGLTGGYASSWAASAAYQAQNDYNQQLSGIIPTLYDAAYNRYMDDYNMDVTNLGLVQGVDNMYYDRYRDTVADNQWQQEFDTSNSQWQQQFDWNKTVDEWNMSNTEATQKFDQLMSKWQLTGVADEEVAAGLGVPVGATTESYYFNKAQLTLDQAKLAQGSRGNGEDEDKVDLNVESIIRNAKERVDKTEDYSEGARYILAAASTTEEYYKIGAQAGIPNTILNEVFDSYYDQALRTSGNEDSGERGYTYYAAMMGQQEDPEAWLEANKYAIPSDILEDLRKLLDY